MTIHTPLSHKEALRQQISATVATFEAAGGVTQRITPEQYREHNIAREADRSRAATMMDLETQISTEGRSTWERMDDVAYARAALYSVTQGDFRMADGADNHMQADGPLRSIREADFFAPEFDDTEEVDDGQED